MKTNILPGIGIVLDTEKAGPNVGILSLTHGNEPAGLHAQEQFLQLFGIKALQRGKVFLLQINPLAYYRNQRFIDVNMNRIGKYLATHKGYEIERVKELKPYLDQLDIILDIHSMSTPISDTIGITATKYQNIAEQILDVDILLVNDDFCSEGSITSYVTGRGGIGFGVECGSHQDQSASKKALEIILAVLRYAQMVPILEDREKIKSPHSVFKFFQEIFPKTEQFHYLKAYSNFYRLAP